MPLSLRCLVRQACILACLALAAPAGVALTITRDRQMEFGSLVPIQANGKVTLMPSGARSTDGVALFSQGSAPASSASFTISGGSAGAVCDIGLPADGTVVATGAGSTMPLNSFTSTPLARITLNGAGGGTIAVGATLSVGAPRPAGDFTAPDFPVTISCP